jgi:hypothetical protein
VRPAWRWNPYSAEKRLLGLFCTFIGLTSFIGYDYYKIYAWSTAEAVVVSEEWRCNYAKKRILLPTLHDSVKCDAKEDAAKLIADGYKYDGSSVRIWVDYQPEGASKIRAVITWWPPEAGWLPRIGSSIRVRYSWGAPKHVEFATKPGRKGLVILIMIVGLVGVSFIALPIARQTDDL